MDVPDAMDSATIGTGSTLVTYDGINPVELDDNTAFHIDFDLNATEEPNIPFKFGDTTLNLRFKYKGERRQYYHQVPLPILFGVKKMVVIHTMVRKVILQVQSTDLKVLSLFMTVSVN